MCTCALSLCGYVRESIGAYIPFGAGASGSCKQSDVDAENQNLGPLEEQYLVLTTESSF